MPEKDREGMEAEMIKEMSQLVDEARKAEADFEKKDKARSDAKDRINEIDGKMKLLSRHMHDFYNRTGIFNPAETGGATPATPALDVAASSAIAKTDDGEVVTDLLPGNSKVKAMLFVRPIDKPKGKFKALIRGTDDKGESIEVINELESFTSAKEAEVKRIGTLIDRWSAKGKAASGEMKVAVDELKKELAKRSK